MVNRFFFLIFNFIIFSTNHGGCVILYSKQGVLDGEISLSRAGRPFNAFYGIPYAEPPVGELRFKNPIPAKSWKGIRNAHTPPPSCLQIQRGVISGQEDCLYLNVYTPHIKNETSLPVMVFIYGGYFMYGNALPERYGPHYFMDRDVIVITFHYRLGVFGFLSTEDEIIPGNYGLKDAVAVLQWVQNYIDDFGGDKNKVTLFGGSSGGISASLALVSPLAQGLFHQVISQSGHPLDMERPGKAKLNAWKYASLVGCGGEDVKTSQHLLNCLKNMSANTLVSRNEDLYTLGDLLPVLPWGPVIENEKISGAFLVDEPRKLLQRKSDIPWITGINTNEGGMMALFTYDKKPSPLLDELNKNYRTHFPLVFRYGYHIINNTEQLDDLTEAYKCRYFGENNISESIHGFSNMFTSLIYVAGIKESVNLYRGPKYVYYYDHKNQQSFAQMYSKLDEKMGIIHGDELISFYNWSSVITPITEGVDMIVSEQVINLWTNFATSGSPGCVDEILWKPVATPTINYLHIKDGVLEMKNQFLKSEIDFLYSLPVNGYF